jgi:hypothetical protein
MYVLWYIHVYAYIVLLVCHSFLIGKERTCMCTENHVRVERIHGSQERGGANAGQHTPTHPLILSHQCLNGGVHGGDRRHHICEHEDVATNQRLHVCTYLLQNQYCSNSMKKWL